LLLVFLIMIFVPLLSERYNGISIIETKYR
jgi:hypothetical protein